MPVESDGTFTVRSAQDILVSLISSLRDQFGNDIDVTPASTPRKFLEAAVLLPMAETENDMSEIYRQMFAVSATGDNLDKHLEFIGSKRKKASRSSGTVEINFNSVQTSDPVFAAGTLEFSDTNDRDYSLTSAVSQPAKVFDSNQTGTASSTTIDGTGDKIAQKVTLSDTKFVQAFGAEINVVSGSPSFTVRLETDSGGDPSGTLVDARLERTGFSPADATFTTDVWAKGQYVDAGDYWLVFEWESGSATFDGGTGGTADQVKGDTGGGYTLDSNVENLNAEVIEGGLASVQADFFGARGNIDANSISGVSFSTGSVQTNWNNNVSTFENINEFEGGQNEESDRAYRGRVRKELASKPESSPSGLQTALLSVSGVTDADIIENNTDTGGTENKVFDSNETGTASSTVVDSSGDKIAQKVTFNERRYIEHFTAQLASDTDLVVSVRLENHDAGNDEPDGTLVAPEFDVSGFDFDGTNLTSGQWDEGEYVDTGTYWLVFTWESGSGTFDGGTGGTADQVKGDTGGGYVLDSNVENLNAEVIGGVPPHGFRLFADGGTDADVANAIYDSKSAGVRDDGKDSAVITNRAGQNVTVYFERPTKVQVFVDITISKDPDVFTGDEDTIEDIIIEYIGGTDNDANTFGGLGLNESVIKNEIISRVLDDDLIIGTIDVTDIKLDITDPPTGTANLGPNTGEIFETAPGNITVTLNDA